MITETQLYIGIVVVLVGIQIYQQYSIRQAWRGMDLLQRQVQLITLIMGGWVAEAEKIAESDKELQNEDKRNS
jgi:hypothetical protein